jgi:quinol-cytochrome oxidoreductase complex cytochrome b subunit
MCVVPFSFLLNPTSRLFIYSPTYKLLFWLFFFNCLILGWIGGKSIETPYYEIGQAATLFYFIFFFFLYILEVLNFNLARRK